MRKCSRFENIWDWEPNSCCTNPIKKIILISYGLYFLGRWTYGNWKVISKSYQVILFREKGKNISRKFWSTKNPRYKIIQCLICKMGFPTFFPHPIAIHWNLPPELCLIVDFFFLFFEGNNLRLCLFWLKRILGNHFTPAYVFGKHRKLRQTEINFRVDCKITLPSRKWISVSILPSNDFHPRKIEERERERNNKKRSHQKQP